MRSKPVVLLCGIAVLALATHFLPHPEETESNPKTASPPRIERQTVDWTALAERLAAPSPLSSEQVEEDERVDAEQVASARRWLESPDPAQRIVGAEQLSAYPTPEAEVLLRQALAADPDPEVRSAAADSLEHFDEPTAAAIASLLSALEDPENPVRRSAFSTLQGLMAEEPADSPTYQEIATGLKRKQASRRVDKKTRRLIADFLSDRGIGKRTALSRERGVAAP